jgi:hypothetical protein
MNSFLFLANWNALWRELWMPLSKTESAPSDLFIEIYRHATKELGIEPKDEALSDAKLAKEEFKKLPIPPTEKVCIQTLEGFYEVLSDFKTDIAYKYYLKLKDFIESRNLRYILTPNCKIRLSLTGLLISHYYTLKKSAVQIASTDPRRLENLTELEKKIGNIKNDDVERDCIRVASNLIEEVVVSKSTNGEKTLGKALKGCPNLFPHKSFVNDVVGFYDFACDYPNLRHPGTQSQKIRDLKKDDAILSIWLAVMFSSYIAENDSCELILSGEI